MSKSIIINDQNFILDASGAIYWVEEQSLLIADVHFGKISHFRKHGAAVPQSAISKNFEKLDTLVASYNPACIFFLGDLFHSKLNLEWNNFENWLRNNPIKIKLISGNHDIIPNYLFEELGVEVFEALHHGSFLLTHHPTKQQGLFNFSGHIHPGIRLQGAGRQYVNLPCFYKTDNQMILPAFGTFTGKHILRPKKRHEIYVIAEEEVIQVSTDHTE